MSQEWDVYCLDCDVGSGLEINHGDGLCAGLIEIRRALAELKGSVVDEVIVYGAHAAIEPSFYKEHEGHCLRPVSEHGNFGGDCNQYRPTGPHYTDCATCRLGEGHDGLHHYKMSPTRGTPAWKEHLLAAKTRIL